MRIISGEKRALKLIAPETLETRPTLDRVKESIFNVIYSRKSNYDVVLDLFAGSGSLGLETVSRGSLKAIFCDSSKDAIKVIKQNIAKCGFENRTVIYNLEYISCLRQLKKENVKVDLILLDPPYNKGMGIDAIKNISVNNLLNDDGIIVLETDILEEIPKTIDNFEMIDERKYGKVKIYLYMRKE